MYKIIPSHVLDRAIYYLFIAIIYINILSPAPFVKKWLGLSILILGVVFMLLHKTRVANSQYLYIIASFLMILILAVISITKGNQTNDILIFVTPFSFLLLMPILSSVSSNNKYLFDGAMRHFLFGTLVLSIFIISSVVLVETFNFDVVSLLLDKFDNYGLMYLPGTGIRVSVQSGVLLPPGLFISWYLFKSNGGFQYVLYFVVIISAIFFTKTFGIWGGTIVGGLVMIFMLTRNKIKALIYICTLIVATSLIGYVVVSDARSDEVKNLSFSIKEQQVVNGLKAFYDKPLLGQGLGSKKSLDHRNVYAPVIETLPVSIIVDGGIFGSIIYLLIYLTPFFIYIKNIKYDWRAVILPAHLSILIAGFSNPYFISGSVGFFFIAMLFIFVSRKKPVEILI